MQRLWGWSCSAPEVLPLEHRRSYEVVAQTFVLASLGHLLFACVLVGLQIPLLIVLNLACVATNTAALMLHRRLQLTWAMTVKLTATLLLITMSVWLIGPDAGFEYYFFLLLCEMLISDMAARYKIVMSTTIGSVALATLLMAPHSTPWMLETVEFREDIRLTNLVMVFLILGLILWRLHAITERCEHHFRRDPRLPHHGAQPARHLSRSRDAVATGTRFHAIAARCRSLQADQRYSRPHRRR
ncbi:hypothetical protein [Chromohalobacter japonicus]|uniref:hypothetical protein n=1 Tax=Chromohalobacter japonicus TaxID=223900 RepID=UPI00211D440E|nr:hypothetical protein [Chromohalobacter japonicus]